MKRELAMAVLMVGGLAGYVGADIAPDPLITGGATVSGKNLKNTPVAMLGEEVDLRPGPARNEVTAVFVMKNTSDQEVSLEVGFPAYGEMPLRDFVAEVDGVKVAAELKKQEQKLEAGGRVRKVLKMDWMTWPMTFAGNAEHKVKVSYWASPERTNRWYRQEVVQGRPTTIVDDGVNDQDTTLPEDVKAKIAVYHSGYVLRTGAGWHGTIGRAVIRLHYGDDVQKERLAFTNTPAGGEWAYDAAAKVDMLTLTDFEPDERSDIGYQYRAAGPAEQEKLLVEGLKKGQLDARSRMVVLEMVKKSAGKDQARVIEAMEYVLPPSGAAIDATKVYPKLEDELKAVHDQLMHHYATNRQMEKGIALGEAYLRYIDELVKGYEGRYTKKYVEQRTAYWMGERKKVEKYVAGMKAGL